MANVIKKAANEAIWSPKVGQGHYGFGQTAGQAINQRFQPLTGFPRFGIDTAPTVAAVAQLVEPSVVVRVVVGSSPIRRPTFPYKI
jgi:hypothetical protein